MAYAKRSKRNGTGPYKGSYIRRKGGKVGRRRHAGQKCPKRGK
jgi:hypothetical protein